MYQNELPTIHLLGSSKFVYCILYFYKVQNKVEEKQKKESRSILYPATAFFHSLTILSVFP